MIISFRSVASCSSIDALAKINIPIKKSVTIKFIILIAANNADKVLIQLACHRNANAKARTSVIIETKYILTLFAATSSEAVFQVQQGRWGLRELRGQRVPQGRRERRERREPRGPQGQLELQGLRGQREPLDLRAQRER